MPLVKYTSKPSNENTVSLRFAAGQADLDGDPIEVTDDEYYGATSGGYGLEIVKSDSVDEKPEALSPVVSPPTQLPAVSSTEPVFPPASNQ